MSSKHAPEVEFVRCRHGNAALEDADRLALHCAAARAFVVAHGEEPLLIPAGFGQPPQLRLHQTPGIPAFVTPYANPDEANHAPNEEHDAGLLLQRLADGGPHCARAWPVPATRLNPEGDLAGRRTRLAVINRAKH